MIDAFVFDLDGTLVQTERLKAQSYARAAVDLCPDVIEESDVMDAYADVVGESRRTVATTLVERFHLEEPARDRMQSMDAVDAPWQAFVQVRLDYYEALVQDPDVLRAHRWPHTLALLERARRNRCAVALATTSRRKQACRVLDVLDLAGTFDFVATSDDVTETKPHPEIYRLCTVELGVPPSRTLAIEDSPTGAQAAVTAGLRCIAVGTPFTRRRLYEDTPLDPTWVVDDPADVAATVDRLLADLSSG